MHRNDDCKIILLQQKWDKTVDRRRFYSQKKTLTWVTLKSINEIFLLFAALFGKTKRISVLSGDGSGERVWLKEPSKLSPKYKQKKCLTTESAKNGRTAQTKIKQELFEGKKTPFNFCFGMKKHLSTEKTFCAACMLFTFSTLANCVSHHISSSRVVIITINFHGCSKVIRLVWIRR